MTLSPVDTLWSGRGGGCNLHVARLFGRPITITTAYQIANQVAMRNFVVRRIVKGSGERYWPVCKVDHGDCPPSRRRPLSTREFQTGDGLRKQDQTVTDFTTIRHGVSCRATRSFITGTQLMWLSLGRHGVMKDSVASMPCSFKSILRCLSAISRKGIAVWRYELIRSGALHMAANVDPLWRRFEVLELGEPNLLPEEPAMNLDDAFLERLIETLCPILTR